MTERNQQIQVGAVFLFALVALVVGILWFKEFKLGRGMNEVLVEFPKTSGLVKGDPVEVRGVQSGQVARIRYTEGRSLVTLSLQKDVALYRNKVVIERQDWRARNSSRSTRDLGRSSSLRRRFSGQYQPGIPELMDDLGGSVASFQRLATRLENVWNAGGPGRQIIRENSLERRLHHPDLAKSCAIRGGPRGVRPKLPSGDGRLARTLGEGGSPDG
jgi:hypothetical protein